MNPEDLFVAIAKWSGREDSILAAAVCGSYARGIDRPESDIDICLVCDHPQMLLDDRTWIRQFGAGTAGDQEDYGLMQSIRVDYDDGLEVEFGIASHEWMDLPIDSETAQVMVNGLRILYDPEGRLARALASVLEGRNSLMKAHSNGIAALYERHAHHYETDRNRSLRVESGWLKRFVSLLEAGDTVLDMGCGHGEPIARYLIETGFRVTGIDTSPTLISLCRKRFPEHEWFVRDMRTLHLGKTYQGLLAWDSFFHLSPDDQRRMFPIFGRHAAPGAALLFTSGTSHGETIGAYRGEPLYHASLSVTEYSDLLAANGFGVRAHVAEDPDCGFHTVWLAQSLEPSVEVKHKR